jgi:hypothetical protein
MTYHHGCGPRGHGPKVYKFQFGGPHMFAHGMGGCGGYGFDFDLELDDKESAEKFMKRNKKWLESRKAGIEKHLSKLNTAIERIDGISADLAKNENYDANEFQKTLIKAFKKFMIEQIDEE